MAQQIDLLLLVARYQKEYGYYPSLEADLRAAFERKECPECAVDLSFRDIRAHSMRHWPVDIPARTEYGPARARQRMLAEVKS